MWCVDVTSWAWEELVEITAGKINRRATFTLQKTFPLKIKGTVYKSCVRSAMETRHGVWPEWDGDGNETWDEWDGDGNETWDEWDGDFVKNRLSHGEKYVWSEISGQEVDKIFNTDVGLERSNGSTGRGQ